jgi:hypothetical protein
VNPPPLARLRVFGFLGGRIQTASARPGIEERMSVFDAVPDQRSEFDPPRTFTAKSPFSDGRYVDAEVFGQFCVAEKKPPCQDVCGLHRDCSLSNQND